MNVGSPPQALIPFRSTPYELISALPSRASTLNRAFARLFRLAMFRPHADLTFRANGGATRLIDSPVKLNTSMFSNVRKVVVAVALQPSCGKAIKMTLLDDAGKFLGDGKKALDVLGVVNPRHHTREEEKTDGFPMATNGHVRLDRMPSSTINLVGPEFGCLQR